MTLAATYSRVSTDRQEREGHSFEEQRRLLRERADGCELFEEYGDPGWSGSREDRPDLQRMLADAEAGAFEVLFIYDITRLSRDVIHLMTIMRCLETAGVKVEPLSGDPASTETADDELAFIARGMVGQYERRKLAERVSMAARAKAAKGEAPGARHRPTGLRVEDKRYVPIEEWTPIIERIFNEAEMYGQHRLAQRLNDAGLRTPQGYEWTQKTVSYILRRPEYMGAMSFKGEVVCENAHEAIIEPEQWHRVQRIISERTRTSAARGRKTKGAHLFAEGKLHCACGRVMRPRVYRSGTEVYVCRSRRDRGTNHCGTPILTRESVDGSVWRLFERVGHDPESTLALQVESHQFRLREQQAVLVQAERRELEAREAVERADRDYGHGELSVKRYERLSAKYEAEFKAAVAEVEQLRAQVQAEESREDPEEAMLRGLAELRTALDSESVDAKRAALLRLFERFDLDEHEPGRYRVVPVLREGVMVSEDPPTVEPTGIRLPARQKRSSGSGFTPRGRRSSATAGATPSSPRTGTASCASPGARSWIGPRP